MTVRSLLLAAVLAFAQAASSKTAFAQSLPLVPQPATVTLQQGKRLTLPAVISVSTPDDAAWKQHLEIVNVHLDRMTQGKHKFDFSNNAVAVLHVQMAEAAALESPEAYSLVVTEKQIQLQAASLKGLARATSTLMQLIGGQADSSVPYLSITDAPTLSYRNFMVDMGRNPHSVELLKETIDLLWFYKVDSMHLHLTDDQRIAFPSTAFPKLWDGKITVAEFKDVEAYAVARGITIIPELEVPGHSGILRREYPDVFGKSGTDLVKTPAALKGIKTLLDEMMDVFSSTAYIHIGGDEAYGVPEDLQRDLINTLHAYLKSKGRQTMVWEGPRPGKGKNKVNTEVIHINWRTINYPANKMLDDGYRVVNAAWDPLYIVDHYPRTNFTMTSPQHVYETLSLTRFKHVNPGLPTFAKPIITKPSDRLIGFCMPWWEGREKNYFPQNVPRIIPFADVAWDPDVKRDFAEFSARAEKTEAVRHAAFYPVRIEASDLVVADDGVFHNQTAVKLSFRSDRPDLEIRYTLDGKQPTATSPKSSAAMPLSKTATVRAAAFADGKQVGHGSRRNLTMVTVDKSPASGNTESKQTAPKNLALGKPATSSVSSGSPFSVQRVTDGGTDNLDFYLGYPATVVPVEVTVDLQDVQQVSRVVVFAYSVSGSFEKYTVEVSVDGKNFEQVGTRLTKPEKPTPSVEHKFTTRGIRYVRISSEGNKGYVFDSFSKLVEVQVY